MKKIFFLLILVLVVAVSSASAAEPGATSLPTDSEYHSWYVGLGLNADIPYHSDVKGSSTGTIDYKNSFSLPDLFVGYRPKSLYGIMGDFRIEEELAGHGFAIDGRNGQNASTGKKGYLGTSALMTNIYYDIHTGSRFTPFVGAGIGIAKSHFSKNPGYGITDKTSSGASFAYQFKAGVSYMPEGWNNFSFNLAYVYFNGGSPKFDASGGKEKIDDFSSNGIELGVSYAF